MKVDLREKLNKEKVMKTLPKDHRDSFEQLLQKELHQKKNYTFLKIAAAVLIIFSLGIAGNQFFKPAESQGYTQTEEVANEKVKSMADISPELKRVEDFYLTRINYQISKITITEENKDLLEVYLSELSDLQQEYNKLKTQLNADKISEEVIEGLIENLQLRLQLLRQLKKKLDIIENLKIQENENDQV
ncbi:MAG: hypothetical protein ABFR32_10380 [Bacteroidota bacterium]